MGRRALLWSAIVVGLVALVACTPAAQAPAQPEKPAAQAPAAKMSEAEERHARLVEGAMQEGQLEVWAWNIRDEDEVIAEFNEQYPFISVTVFDSRGDEMLARRAEEERAGRFSNSVFYLTTEIEIAYQRGYLEEYEFPGTEDWPFQPDHNFFRRWGQNARLIVYNTNTVRAEDVPTTWEALIEDPRYQNYDFVVTTSGEDTPLFMANMWGGGESVEWDRTFDYWTRFVETHQPAVQSGYTGTLELVAAGEFDFMPAATTSSTISLIKRGAPLAFAPTDLGTAQPAAAVGLAKNAPHPNAARLWIDFFNTPEGHALWMNKVDQMSIQGGRYDELNTAKDTINDLGIDLVWTPPELLTEENLGQSADFWFDLLGVRQ